MKRKISLLILSALFISLFTSCAKGLVIAADVSGAEVTKGIYTYFYDYAAGNTAFSESYDEDVKNEAQRLVKQYVAVNSLADKLDVSLSYQLKSDCALETENTWDFFSQHYEKIGVTKQDMHKIKENEGLKTALLDYFYGQDSEEEPVSEKKLRKEFEKSYIGVKIIAASLSVTDSLGNTEALEETEVSRIRNKFTSMKNSLNYGSDIERVYTDYNTGEDLIGTQYLETYIFTASSAQYGKDFFKTISALAYNKAEVIEYEDSIYLVYRVDITPDEYGYFITYESSILSSLKMDDLEEKINAEAETYEIKEHASVVNGIIKSVLSVRTVKSEEETETENADKEAEPESGSKEETQDDED